MHAPGTRARRIAALSAGPVAILLAGLLVWHGSSAAFTAQTRNIGNNWDTGSVALTDDDLGTAAFQITHVTPGQTGSKCITVTSTSSNAGVVKMYLTRLGAQGLESNIIITPEIGTGGGFASCVGFVSESALPPQSLLAVSTLASNYATGVLPWTTTGAASGESKT